MISCDWAVLRGYEGVQSKEQKEHSSLDDLIGLSDSFTAAKELTLPSIVKILLSLYEFLNIGYINPLSNL